MARGDALDRSGRVPLYAQIRDDLSRQIESHVLAPGAQLPTEEELQAEYAVSRSVVRQALGELAQAGLVRRQRGRGSVVAPQGAHRRRAGQAGGLEQQVAARGSELHTSVLGLVAARAPEPAARALGTSETWQLDRLRSVGEDTVIRMRTWLPRRLFPSLTAEGLGGRSLHAWMREAGVEPAGGPRQLRAVPADAEVAVSLGVAVGVPVMLMEGVTQDAGGRGLEWFAAWHGPSTVFDIDAHVGAPTEVGVGSDPAPAEPDGTPDELVRLRSLVATMRSLLDST